MGCPRVVLDEGLNPGCGAPRNASKGAVNWARWALGLRGTDARSKSAEVLRNYTVTLSEVGRRTPVVGYANP